MPGHPVGVGVKDEEAFGFLAAVHPQCGILAARKRKGTIATWPGKPGDSPWQDE